MKLLTSLFSAALFVALPAWVHAEDSYSVFKVCEDQHVIRTSDGAEAGHLEYIVVDPGQQRIVSTIVTGGVIGEKMVAVPYASLRFGPERDVVLTEITRERLVSAPVIERNQINVAVRFQPALVERSFTHFGVRRDVTGAATTSRVEERRTGEERSTVSGEANTRPGERERSTTTGSATTRQSGPAREEGQPGREGARPRAEAGRDAEHPNGAPERNANRERSNAGSESAKESERNPSQAIQDPNHAAGNGNATRENRTGTGAKRQGAEAATEGSNDRKAGNGHDATAEPAGKNSPEASRTETQRNKEAADKQTESKEKNNVSEKEKAAAAKTAAGARAAEKESEATHPAGKAAPKAAGPGEDAKTDAGEKKKEQRTGSEPENKAKAERNGQ